MIVFFSTLAYVSLPPYIDCLGQWFFYTFIDWGVTFFILLFSHSMSTITIKLNSCTILVVYLLKYNSFVHLHYFFKSSTVLQSVLYIFFYCIFIHFNEQR